MARKQFKRFTDDEISKQTSKPAIQSAQRVKREVVKQVKDYFGLTTRVEKSTIRYLNHLAELVIKEELEEQLPQLFKDWVNWFGGDVRTFYYYIKERRLSDLDFFVLEAYQIMAFDKVGEFKFDAGKFKNKGQTLFDRFDTWLGTNIGNTREDLVCDYFQAVIGKVSTFNKGMIYNPNSILNDFAWSLFVEWVENTGGRAGYIKATKLEITNRDNTTSLLNKVSELERILMDEGRLDEIKKIGVYMATCGLPMNEAALEVLREYGID